MNKYQLSLESIHHNKIDPTKPIILNFIREINTMHSAVKRVKLEETNTMKIAVGKRPEFFSQQQRQMDIELQEPSDHVPSVHSIAKIEEKKESKEIEVKPTACHCVIL